MTDNGKKILELSTFSIIPYADEKNAHPPWPMRAGGTVAKCIY